MPRTFVWHPGKGPKTTPALKIKDGETVRIKQVRSGIGHEARMRATLEAMGLRNHQAMIERVLTPQLRGQIKHVRHLLEVVPAGESAAKQPTMKQPVAKRAAPNKASSTASKKQKEEKANG
jgi:large subunit ribosomal protein L30